MMLYYGMFVALVSAGKTGLVLGSTLSAAAGAAINYLLNYFHMFGSITRHASVAPKFFVVAVTVVVVNWGAMQFLIKGVGVYYLVAQCMATVTVLVVTYLINRAWTFKQDVSDACEQAN